MGKNLIQQRRGKGSLVFKAPSFRYAGRAEHPDLKDISRGEIEDIIHSQGHSAPLALVKYDNLHALMIAPETIRVGGEVRFGESPELKPGDTLKLEDIPEGIPIYNIESMPGDGGKFARSSGAAARIVAKTADSITIRLPSKKERNFHPRCLATIGIVAGSGRPEKPFLKAGKKFHRMKARNKFWPSVSGTSMNAVAHPFGGKGSHTKGRPTQAPRNAPPGRKVGKIAPKRTGRRR